MRVVRLFAGLLLVLGFALPVSAQQSVWVQVEAHPTEADAQARIDALTGQLFPLEGYRLRSGWYAIVLGPLSPAEAPSTLRQLRVTRQIPADSFIADGSRFGSQFWPPAGTVAAPAAPETTATAEPVIAEPVEPVDETPAEARRSEAQLTREERMELQTVLAWEGYYNSAIDGAIGRGSRRAMAAWQADQGYEATGILTTRQRAELVSGYRELLASIGMQTYSDPVAGVDIELPLALVEFDRYEPPFVHFTAKDGSGIQVLLISQSGDRATLAGLYEVMQTLDIVPLDGERRLAGSQFSLEGANESFVSTTFAGVSGEDVKGFTLIWPRGDERRRQLALEQMRQSFRAIGGSVLPDDYGTPTGSIDLFAGLSIRQPDVSRSGFFVSDDGWILTNLPENQSCTRVTLSDDTEVDVVARNGDFGLTLLRPADAPLVPVSYATLSSLPTGIGEDIAVAGFSYGNRLGAATVSFGTLEELVGLNAEPDLRRLSVGATDGDIGGPVVTTGGSVLGMLLPQPETGRVLPEGVEFAASTDVLAEFLTQSGLAPAAQNQSQPIAVEDLAQLATDMTVLVQCWN